MLSVARKLLQFVARGDRRRLALLVTMLMLMAITDTLGVASIMPFMAVVARPDIVQGSGMIAAAYQWLGFQSTTSFLTAVGAATLFALVISNAISALANWMLFRFIYLQTHALALRLLTQYMASAYVFHLNRNSAELGKNILVEALRVNVNVMLPALQVLSRVAITILLVAILVAVDPALAIGIALVLSAAYAGVYALARRRLNVLGRQTTAANEICHRVVNEALSGIKDIKIAGREREFLRRFSEPSLRIAFNQSVAQANILVPRYLLETIAFGGVLVIALYLVLTRRDSALVIPTLSLYAFAGYRLMPALQQIYTGITTIRYNQSVLDIVANDLSGAAPGLSEPQPALPFARDIVFDRLSFAYPNSDEVLRDFSLRIESNTTVAITGSSGAGKTTVIDIMLGLLAPSSGRLLVDGREIKSGNVSAWQRNLGYVPQQIFLSDDTIVANIAFGIPDKEVDQDAVRRAAQLAQLDEFVSALPEQYNTVIGEKGVRLSGGQRQRIGIARALYADPPVLILDEATSALDNITEGVIMEAIRQLAHRKTIVIIAHRLTTVQECDLIHLLEGGQVVASGTYDHLMSENQAFQALVAASAAGKSQ